MSDLSTQLDQLQKDIVGRIAADDNFSDVPVIRQAKGVIEQDLAEGLGFLTAKGGKMGACVVVKLPERNVSMPDVPGPQYDLTCPIIVVENALINRGDSGTGKTATTLSILVENLLHQVSFGSITLYAGTAVGGQYVDSNGEPVDGVQQYEIDLHGQFNMSASKPVARPRITLADAAATIACATSGAVIRYTIDGSYPGSDASEYTEPVTLSDGATIRAVAYADGYQASSLSEITCNLTT